MAPTFGEMVAAVQGCRRCPAMEGRRRVLGEANGRLDARVLFIAEAPGRLGAERTGVPMTSDQTGRRFGRMLALAGLERDDVFITNAALCNPQTPDGRNRAPSRRELDNCAGWLGAQIELVQAPVVATLGAVALAALGRIEAHGLTLRADVGRAVAWRGRTLVPLYHPSPRAGLSRSYAAQDEDFRELGRIVGRSHAHVTPAFAARSAASIESEQAAYVERCMTSQLASLRTRGMRDLLPAQMAAFRRVERAFLGAMHAWGYDEVRTPTLEHLHLFTSAGTLSPQLLERVYSFLDWDGWSGERVVLRPDATIPVTRVYSERMAGGVAKLCYVTNIFRFAAGDEPRELWQCGAEVIGDTWPGGDIELIAAGRSALARMGVGDVTVHLSHTGVLRALLERAGFAPEDQAEQYDRLLDGDLSVMRELERRVPALQASLHLLTGVTGGGTAYLANLRAAFASLSPSLARSLDELERVAAAVDALGCPFTIDLTLVRDFEYYTGPVFRFALADGRDLGGGGRYDQLVTEGGGFTPACGFALYLDRLAEALPASEAPSESVAVTVRPATDDAEALGLALSLALELQDKGFCAELASAAGRAESGYLLLVDPRGGDRRYVLRCREDGAEWTAATLEDLIGALGRARC